MPYLWLKLVHLLGVVVYVGGLLALTRWLGKAVRFESPTAREETYRVLKRMHVFVDWGGLFLMVAAGLWLLIADSQAKAYMSQAYFHMKLTFVVALLVTDILVSRKMFRLRGEGPQPGAGYFRALHAVAGLATIGALAAVTVVRG